MRKLVALLLLLPSLAVADTSTERRLALDGVLIEDFGPGVRYWSAGGLSGRFDDDPLALRTTPTGVTFRVPGLTVACAITAFTRRHCERGANQQTTRIGLTRSSGRLSWQQRTFETLTCTVTTAAGSTTGPGAYLASRLTTQGDAP